MVLWRIYCFVYEIEQIRNLWLDMAYTRGKCLCIPVCVLGTYSIPLLRQSALKRVISLAVKAHEGDSSLDMWLFWNKFCPNILCLCTKWSNLKLGPTIPLFMTFLGTLTTSNFEAVVSEQVSKYLPNTLRRMFLHLEKWFHLPAS